MDNADDPDVLPEFLPQGSRGNVIYTSKNKEHALNLAEGACCPVNEMEEDEAVTLLARSARRDKLSEEDARLARSIVAELGYLALAINQAGALVFTGVCDLDDFLGTFRNHRKDLMKNPSYRAASKSDQAVYTTWDISYVRIHEQAQITEGDLDAARQAENAILTLNCLHSFTTRISWKRSSRMLQRIGPREIGTMDQRQNLKRALLFLYNYFVVTETDVGTICLFDKVFACSFPLRSSDRMNQESLTRCIG